MVKRYFDSVVILVRFQVRARTDAWDVLMLRDVTFVFYHADVAGEAT